MRDAFNSPGEAVLEIAALVLFVLCVILILP